MFLFSAKSLMPSSRCPNFVCMLYFIGEVTTWWLEGGSGSDIHRLVRPTVDTLVVPHLSDSASQGSGVTSDSGSDLIGRTTSLHMISRTRSNSIRSYNSSDIKSSYIFRRAESFRHKIKSESLCPSQVRQFAWNSRPQRVMTSLSLIHSLLIT